MQYDLFISYAQKDGDVAAGLAGRLHDAGITYFLADKSILAAAEWEPVIREALYSSERVLLLLTPRSKASLWVAAEAGAAWVLKKDLIPVLMFVEPSEIFELVRKFQARVGETSQQLDALVTELSEGRLTNPRKPEGELKRTIHEVFNTPDHWEQLIKVGQWQFDESTGLITGQGMYTYISAGKYDANLFTIIARMRFEELRPINAISAVNAGIVLGWVSDQAHPRYLHLMFSRTRLLLERVGELGKDEFHDFRHIDEGVPFSLHSGRTYNIILKINNELINVLIDDVMVLSTRVPREYFIGRVGLRPWRSCLKCERFEIM